VGFGVGAVDADVEDEDDDELELELLLEEVLLLVEDEVVDEVVVDAAVLNPVNDEKARPSCPAYVVNIDWVCETVTESQKSACTLTPSNSARLQYVYGAAVLYFVNLPLS
jgi:hypothetical protein